MDLIKSFINSFASHFLVRSRIVDFADCRRVVDNAAGGGVKMDWRTVDS